MGAATARYQGAEGFDPAPDWTHGKPSPPAKVWIPYFLIRASLVSGSVDPLRSVGYYVRTGMYSVLLMDSLINRLSLRVSPASPKRETRHIIQADMKMDNSLLVVADVSQTLFS